MLQHAREARAGRKLASATKQWRVATEARLRLLDSRGEAARPMLDPDAALIDALETYEETVE